MRSTLLTIAAVVFCLAPNTFDDDAKKDQEKMQGEWTLVSLERDGQPAPAEFAKSMKRSVNGNAFTVTLGGQVRGKGTFTLDASKKPKEIDVKTERNQTLRGIYEMGDDTFKQCYGPPGAPRPKDFAAPGGSGITVAVWKRAMK
jgi:uncharacterized protein (TIGR03067 family)